MITISGDYVAVGYLQGVCHVPFVFRINKQIVSAKLVKALQVLLPKKQQIKRRLFTKQKITSKGNKSLVTNHKNITAPFDKTNLG